jgi:hypothetical protein
MHDNNPMSKNGINFSTESTTSGLNFDALANKIID